jgi:hypothetical protein
VAEFVEQQHARLASYYDELVAVGEPAEFLNVQL